MTHGTDSHPLLTIESVSKAFGGVQALRGVSLEVHQGEIRAIIGPNGAGKTTLINLISRVYPPDQGKLLFAGRGLARLATHKIAAGIGRTFQNIALFKGMTVLENLMPGRHPLMRPGLLSSGIYWRLAQKKEGEHRAKVEWIIDFLEITAIRKQVVGALPLGLQKRVELGRALALEPTLLLLDEPRAGMNIEEKENMVPSPVSVVGTACKAWRVTADCDCLQRPLLRRFRFQRRLKPSVRRLHMTEQLTRSIAEKAPGEISIA